MEPQIIDYYNETPHGINVIDKLNEEYSVLQSKYEYIKSITDRYIAPVQIAKNYDEYKKYEKILDEFLEKIREILNDKEYGLLAIYNLDLYPGSVYDRIMHNSWIYICSKYKSLDEEYFKDKIVNELDNITNNKNRKWCEDRIDLALEICLSKYDTINDENSEKIIDDLIHHILNDENPSLPDFYQNIIDFHTNKNLDSDIEFEFSSLSCLNCYHCEKCGILSSYLETGTSLCCQDCLWY